MPTKKKEEAYKMVPTSFESGKKIVAANRSLDGDGVRLTIAQIENCTTIHVYLTPSVAADLGFALQELAAELGED